MSTRLKAKQAVALKMCEILHKKGNILYVFNHINLIPGCQCFDLLVFRLKRSLII